MVNMRILLCIFLLTISKDLFAQNLTKQAKLTPIFTDLFNGMPIARPERGVVGETYLIDKWQPVSMQLVSFEKEITGYVAKYDLYSFQLHFKLNNEIRTLTPIDLKSFTIFDSIPRQFISTKKFETNDHALSGFLEVLVEGDFPLYRYNYLLIKKPDYNAALNAGSRDTRVFKKSDLYTTKDNSLVKLKSKKEFYSLLGDNEEEVKKYGKTNLLSFNSDNDLIKIFMFLNSLKTN
jgi:hypothetical protein